MCHENNILQVHPIGMATIKKPKNTLVRQINVMRLISKIWENVETRRPNKSSHLICLVSRAELEEWTTNLTIYSYEDDTSSSTQGKNVSEFVSKLEEDGEEILKFMAS